MSNNLSQGAYAPLPQSLSDSDSEKEISLKQRPKFAPSHTEEILLHNGYGHSFHEGTLPEVKKVTPAMSTKRKICFVFSIAACFLTVIVFLWVLPCSESGTCPVRISSWEVQHEGIELMGKINVVKSAFRNIQNLAVMFKRDIRFADSQSGILSILGNNGAVAWYINQSVPPAVLNCNLIDVNDDGINDCLVISEIGLEAVDPVSGNNFWYAHNHTQRKPIAGLDLPIILQDLNHDNVREILTAYNHNGECRILIISGKTGILIGEIAIKNCEDFHIIESNATTILFSRLFKHHPLYHQVTIADLITKIFERVEVLEVPIYTGLPVIDFGYLLEGHRLFVKNTGTCTYSNNLQCPVSISMVNEKTQRPFFTWEYPNTFGFKPVMFSFKRTRANSNSHVNGFIVKLWQLNSSDKVIKRSVLVNNTNTTIKVNSITERILLITFNSTNFRVVNASLTNITQLCVQAYYNDYRNCQPNKENQMNSLLISDLDMDDSQEFISYSSTFVNHGEVSDDWQLVAMVKVLRLEDELPKFFEVNKNV